MLDAQDSVALQFSRRLQIALIQSDTVWDVIRPVMHSATCGAFIPTRNRPASSRCRMIPRPASRTLHSDRNVRSYLLRCRGRSNTLCSNREGLEQKSGHQQKFFELTLKPSFPSTAEEKLWASPLIDPWKCHNSEVYIILPFLLNCAFYHWKSFTGLELLRFQQKPEKGGCSEIQFPFGINEVLYLSI